MTKKIIYICDQCGSKIKKKSQDNMIYAAGKNSGKPMHFCNYDCYRAQIETIVVTQFKGE